MRKNNENSNSSLIKDNDALEYYKNYNNHEEVHSDEDVIMTDLAGECYICF